LRSKKFKDVRVSFLKRMDKYDLLEELGSGKFGTVHRATVKGHSEMSYAIKSIRLKNESARETFMTELAVQTGLSHPNVVKLIEWFRTDATHRHIVLEFAPIEVFNLLDQRGRFGVDRTCRYIIDVCKGLKYLHSQKIMHRDIKPENLLLDPNGVIKIADFGLSKRCVSNPMRAESICGTLDYLPPEMVREVIYDHRVDIWSTGVLAYEFLVGEAPFASKSKRKTRKRINEGKYTFPGFVPDDACVFVSKFIKILPRDRITLDDVISDPWAKAQADSFVVVPETYFSDSEGCSSSDGSDSDSDVSA
jgi:serine/threonine protein kinase